MARDHARLDVHIWTDDDYRDLSVAAKMVYLQLLSQPKLSYAGVLDLAVKRWARAHPDLGTAGVRAALSELDAARFVVVDQDTEEVLVRSFIRNDGLYKQPNVLRAALRVAFEIESPILRGALAAELRRLPGEVTGPAPAVAADELESAAHELPPSVKAAFTIRAASRGPVPVDQRDESIGASEPRDRQPARVEASGNPSTNPTGNPCAKDRGEGSRERETGVASLALVSDQVGVRAPTSAPPRTRARETATPPADMASDSRRQHRRGEAERLVRVHAPAQPPQVVARLRAEVITMLRAGVEPAHLAAGLRAWSSKQLTVSLLPELVGEAMRVERVHASAGTRRSEMAAAATFERIRSDAIADSDTSPTGRAVRGQIPAHATAADLRAILERALTESMAVSA